MGLAETIKKSVAAGFASLGNLVVTVEYDSYVTARRNVVSGYTSTVANRYTVGGVFGNFKHDETLTGTEINPSTDQKFIFLQKELPVTPSVRDNVHQVIGGIEYNWSVVGFRRDSANATWVVGLRRRGG